MGSRKINWELLNDLAARDRKLSLITTYCYFSPWRGEEGTLLYIIRHYPATDLDKLYARSPKYKMLFDLFFEKLTTEPLPSIYKMTFEDLLQEC